MNPDADPTLSALFAEPMHEVRDDPRALAALLGQLERTDRRRGLILGGAGVVGALFAIGIIAASNVVPASIAGTSALSVRLMKALANAVPDATTWSLPGRLLPAGAVPDGSVTIGLGVVVLALAATAAFRWRGFD